MVSTTSLIEATIVPLVLIVSRKRMWLLVDWKPPIRLTELLAPVGAVSILKEVSASNSPTISFKRMYLDDPVVVGSIVPTPPLTLYSDGRSAPPNASQFPPPGEVPHALLRVRANVSVNGAFCSVK